MSILKYIELGTNAKEWFNYDGNPLPIRPLSSYEMDNITMKVIKEGITHSTFQQLIKLKLNLISPDEEVILDQANYVEFFKYYNEIDYWVVYNSIKDFQEESFSMPDYEEDYATKYDDWKPDRPKGYYIVREMKHVHEIAKDVKNMTSQSPQQLVEVLRSHDGKVLASRIFLLHVPLVSEAWKMTPLQSDFLYYARPGAPIMLKDKDELPGIKGGTMEEVMEQLRKLGIK